MTEGGENKLQRVAIYVACLSLADSMLVGYRNLFLVIETLLFTLAIGLLSIDKVDYLWIPIFLGLIFCFSSFFVFAFAKKRVDYWRDRIFEEIQGTDLQKVFGIYLPVYVWRIPSPSSPRFWFDVLSPVALSIVWISLLYFSYLRFR